MNSVFHTPQAFEDCFGVFQPPGPPRLAAKWTVLVLRSDRDAPLTRVVVGCVSEWEARLLRETLLRARQLTYPCVPMRAQGAEESEKCEDSASDQECPSRNADAALVIMPDGGKALGGYLGGHGPRGSGQGRPLAPLRLSLLARAARGGVGGARDAEDALDSARRTQTNDSEKQNTNTSTSNTNRDRDRDRETEPTHQH